MRISIGARTLLCTLALFSALSGISLAHATPLPKPRPIVVDLSDPRNCLARAVYQEARGEIFKGQMMVAYVVRYRALLDSPGFGGKSICAVVSAKKQFDGIKGKTWAPANIASWQMALRAADEVLWHRFVPEGELRFSTFYMQPQTSSLGGKCWFEQTLVPIRWVGNHLFFREPLAYEKPVATHTCTHIARR